MRYDEAVKMLLLEFPNLEANLAENNHLEGLPHCIFEMIFVPHIIYLCNKNKAENLAKVADFLEKMAVSDDVRVKELLSVSVAEPLILSEKNYLSRLKKVFLKETLKEISYWESMYL